MIDIHNHSMYAVDDGAATLEESIKMLEIAANQGITDVVLTPHYRHGMFRYPTDLVKKHYEILKNEQDRIGIHLYPGCEYHVNNAIAENLASGRCASLAGGVYVLTEYAFETEESYIRTMTQELLFGGHIPVIAHAERYGAFLKKISLCEDLKQMGAFIQVNADSVLGLEGMRTKSFCKKLLKHDFVDVVASDSHGVTKRANHMAECMHYIEKKYGMARAQLLFEENPRAIIENR